MGPKLLAGGVGPALSTHVPAAVSHSAQHIAFNSFLSFVLTALELLIIFMRLMMTNQVLRRPQLPLVDPLTVKTNASPLKETEMNGLHFSLSHLIPVIYRIPPPAICNRLGLLTSILATGSAALLTL